MKFTQVPFRLGALLLAGACLLLLAMASTAPAATINKYAPSGEARNFANSLGGWSGTVGYDGLCVPGLTCPAVDNSFRPGGGADGPGDGYIETGLGSLLGVGAISTGTFRSPSFVYKGAGGKPPHKLKFRMSRRADVGALLAVAGNSADYSVALEKIKGGAIVDSIQIVPPTTMAGANGWTSIDPVAVDPAVLQVGSSYRIAIASTFTTGAEVIPGGSADYDRVLLRAMRRGGGGTVSPKQLDKIVAAALPGSVRIAGGKVKTRLKCQRKAPGKCKFRKLKLIAQRKAQTKKRKAAVRSGKKKTVGLKPRGKRGLRTLRHRRKALLTGKIVVGGKTRKISRRVKVRTR